MRWGNDTTNWYIARVTQIPTSVEKAYLLTIQALQGRDLRWLDKIAGEHPDALE